MTSRRHLAGLTATVLVAATLVASPAAAASLGVSSLSAASGPLVGGERISLHGNGFTHVSKVLFGGAAGHAVRVTSAHLLTVVVPKHKAGRIDIRVVTGGGKTPLVKADRFTYVPPPAVTKLTTSGTRVTLKGKNFSHVKAVLFGKTKGTNVHVVSTTTLLVTAPAHLPGVVDVRVTTAYGTSKSTKADQLSYAASVGQGQPTAPTPPVPTPVPPPTVTTTSLPPEVSGNNYAAGPLSATGGVPPYTWSVTGLPNGLVLGSDGALSGSTFAVPRLYRVTTKVADSRGLTSTAVLSLTVTPHAGQLYAFGENDTGQVANGATSVPVTSPYLVPGMSTAVSVAGDRENGWVAKADGTVWNWGLDTDGQLGDGIMSATVSSPKQVVGLSHVVAVAGGTLAAYALTSDGTVFAWGLGTGGQLGDGSTTSSSTPVQVQDATDIVSIAAGNFAAYAVRSDGTVIAWGADEYGQLGDGGHSSQSTPIAVPGLTDVVSVTAGMNDAFALHANGTVSAWGHDDVGQLGLGTAVALEQDTPVLVPGLTGITQVAAGETNAYAVASDGTAWGWGSNTSGAVGVGDSVAVRSPKPLPDLTDVEAISAFEYGAFAVLAGGTVKDWGDDHYGELGDGAAAINKLSPATAPWQTNTLTIGPGAGAITNFVIKRVKVAPPPVNPIPPPEA